MELKEIEERVEAAGAKVLGGESRPGELVLLLEDTPDTDARALAVFAKELGGTLTFGAQTRIVLPIAAKRGDERALADLNLVHALGKPRFNDDGSISVRIKVREKNVGADKVKMDDRGRVTWGHQWKE